MLIIIVTMVGAGKRLQLLLALTVGIFVLILTSSCGVSGKENKEVMFKEKGMGSTNASLASRAEGEAIKDLKGAHVEKATFALG